MSSFPFRSALLFTTNKPLILTLKLKFLFVMMHLKLNSYLVVYCPKVSVCTCPCLGETVYAISQASAPPHEWRYQEDSDLQVWLVDSHQFDQSKRRIWNRDKYIEMKKVITVVSICVIGCIQLFQKRLLLWSMMHDPCFLARIASWKKAQFKLPL